MKRVLLAVFLIIFSLSSALFAHFYIKGVSTEIEVLLESVLFDAAPENSAIYENIERVLEKWNKHGKIFGVFLKNPTTEEMEAAFCELEFFFDSRQNDSLRQAVIKCIFLLKSVIEGEKFSFGNIF